MRTYLLIISLLAVAVNAYYYLEIKRGKSLKEFMMNFFLWATDIMIKNNGADRYRKKYMKVNNYCMLVFWITVIAQFVLLFEKK